MPILLITSLRVPLKGPGNSIFIDARDAANLIDSSIEWSSLRAIYALNVVSPRPVLPALLLLEKGSK